MISKLVTTGGQQGSLRMFLLKSKATDADFATSNKINYQFQLNLLYEKNEKWPKKI